MTEGMYSDYRIVRVFLEKDLAEEYVRIMEEDYHLETYEVTEGIPEITTLHTRLVEIHSQTGEVVRDSTYSSTYEPQHHDTVEYLLHGKELHWRREARPGEYHYPPRIKLDVVGLDPERVKKVAQDRMAQERAQILGL